jgi:hypothetical protein
LWLATVLTVMLAGLPLVLVVLFGMPFPRHPPQHAYLHEWIVSSVVLALWLLWLVLLTLVVRQVAAALRRVRLPHPQLANPPEGLLAGLVGATIMAGSTVGSRGTLPAPPAPSPVPVEMPDPPSAGPASVAQAPASGPAPAGVGQVTETAATAAPTPTAGGFGAAAGRDPAHGSPAGGRSGSVGVDLPGGWVDRDTGQAVSAVVGLWWLRRRRRYLPRPLSGSGRADSDLAGVPETAAVIVQALHGTGVDDLDLLDPAAGQPLPADRAGAAAPTPSPTAGTAVAGGDQRTRPVRPGDVPDGGVGLAGPGAGAAARGLITAALLAAGRPGPGVAGQVWMTAADLTGLLDQVPAADIARPGLWCSRTWAACWPGPRPNCCNAPVRPTGAGPDRCARRAYCWRHRPRRCCW